MTGENRGTERHRERNGEGEIDAMKHTALLCGIEGRYS